MFEIENTNDPASMLKAVKENYKHANMIRATIAKLKNPTPPSSTKSQPIPAVVSREPSKWEVEYIQDTEFDERLEKIIKEYRKLTVETKEDLLNILLEIDSYDFNYVIYRLLIESQKDIIEMTKIKVATGESSDIDDLIANEQRKIMLLKKLLNDTYKEQEEDNNKNNIVLAPNRNGEIFIFDDIAIIPPDYYDEIYNLIQSIIGNRKTRQKLLKTKAYVESGGFYQIRSGQLRAIFRRLNKDTYAILYIFIKKEKTSEFYRQSLINRFKSYMETERDIMRIMDDPEFVELNNQRIEDLWNKLRSNKQVEKKLNKKSQV